MQTIDVDIQNSILTVTLNRPQVKNAFNKVMIAELTEVFSKNYPIRAAVLQGNGDTFCAGGDLNWMRESIELSYEDNVKDTSALTQCFAIMNRFPYPLIGKVKGAAIGGGVGLVSVCDHVIAHETTQFSLSEVRLGIIPACISPFVIAKIGPSHARSLFITAERFTGPKAKSIGLIHHSSDRIDEDLEELIKRIQLCGLEALKASKALVHQLSLPEERQQIDPYDYVSRTLARIRVSEEGQEGVRAFLEKRAPRWTHE